MITRPATSALAACLAALLALSAAADEPQDEYAVAAGHYARGRWDLAAEAFSAFLDRFPKHAHEADAHFFLAESLVQTEKLPEARDRYARLLRDYPESRHARQALFRIGEIGYLEGDHAAAKRDLLEFRAKYPRDALNAYVLPALAEMELDDGDAAAAETLYRDALSAWPDGPRQDECRVGLARALEKRGRAEEAELLLVAVADKRASPAAEMAGYYLGSLKYSTADYRAAEEKFAALAHSARNNHWRDAGRLGQAKTLVQLRQFEKAEQLLAALVDHPQQGAEAAYWLGLSAKSRGDFAAAERVLAEAAEKHDRHELAEALLFHAGDSARRAGRHAEAIALLERLLARPVGPWHDDALLCKLRAALAQGQHAEVDALADRIEKEFSGTIVHKHALRALARSLTERNLHTQARLILEPLTEKSDKDDPLARADLYLLAVAYVGEQRGTEALRAADAVLAEAAGTLRADAQVVRSSALVLLGRFDEAIVPLRDYLAELPDGPRAATCKSELCYCLARTHKLDEARGVHDELLRRHGSTQQTRTATLRLADEVYQQGDYAWAAELYESLTKTAAADDVSARALSGLGWSKMQKAQQEDAAAEFAQLLARYPNSPLVGEAALARGHILQQLEQHDAALAMYDLAIQRGTPREQPQALFAAARLNAKLGRHQQAERLCRQLDERFPDDHERDAVLYQWAWALVDLGRKADGLARFEEIHDRHPHGRYWPDATYRLAEAALESGDFPACQRLSDEVVSRHPDNELVPHARFLLGRVAAAQNDWERAAAHMEPLARDDRDAALALRARYWIAEAAYRQRKFDAAALKFAGLRRQLPASAEPWTAVIPLREAQTLAQLSRWEDALAAAEPIARDYPGFDQQHEADYVVGRSLAGLGRFREAREAYERVLRSVQDGKTETAAMAQWMIGETYFHQRDYEAALRAYLRVEPLFDYPQWQAAALLQAAKCYEQLQRPAQAKGLYERIVKEFAGTQYRPEAEERLRSTRTPARTTRKP
ncbi:MAG: tetratricopeptide repeat protein [Planctomycetia bacterium]|nr:tetratricopeptide repeat protein [Planctomycetia bacterium]